MIPFILGALAAVGLSELSKRKMADGGLVSINPDEFDIKSQLYRGIVEVDIFDSKTHDLVYTYNFDYSNIKCEDVVSFESTSGGYGYDYKEVYSEPTFEDCSSEVDDYILNHYKDWVKV